MPSAGLRFAAEAAFLGLVATGLVLARFSPLVIVVVMVVALVLVAVLERASAKAARAREPSDEESLPVPPPHVERAEPVSAKTEFEPTPEPEPAVGERSARAILASGPPPLPPEPPKEKPRPARRVIRVPARPKVPPSRRAPEPEPVPVVLNPAREWNLWELQRAVRDAVDDDRHEERSALLMYLREFAGADGNLPTEFDPLVRESFGPLLDTDREAATAT